MEKIVYPDLIMKMRVFDEYVFPNYIVSVLQSSFNRQYFVRNAKGTSETMQKINQLIVRETLISLPPFAEQKRIVEKVDELMQLCDELEERVKKNKTNSTNLMGVILRKAFANEA